MVARFGSEGACCDPGRGIRLGPASGTLGKPDVRRIESGRSVEGLWAGRAAAMLPVMSHTRHSRRKIPTSRLRVAAQDLSRASSALEPELLARLRRALEDEPVAGPEPWSAARSRSELQRIMTDRLQAAWRVDPDPERLSELVLDAVDLRLVVRPEVVDATIDRLVDLVEHDEDLERLALADYGDYPSYQGVDLHLRARRRSAPHPKVRLRIQTPGQAEHGEGLPELTTAILELRPKAEAVARDFGNADDLEVYYFLELLPDLGFDRSDPAGLYCLLTTAAQQVACYWAPDGWHPSARVEAWIVGAEPSLEPVDGAEAQACMEAWSEGEAMDPTSDLAGRRN